MCIALVQVSDVSALYWSIEGVCLTWMCQSLPESGRVSGSSSLQGKGRASWSDLGISASFPSAKWSRNTKHALRRIAGSINGCGHCDCSRSQGATAVSRTFVVSLANACSSMVSCCYCADWVVCSLRNTRGDLGLKIAYVKWLKLRFVLFVLLRRRELTLYHLIIPWNTVCRICKWTRKSITIRDLLMK